MRKTIQPTIRPMGSARCSRSGSRWMRRADKSGRGRGSVADMDECGMMTDQKKIARGRELGARDEQAAVNGHMRPQPPHQRRRMPLLGQPHMPALIETRFGAEAPHGADEINCQVAFMANLKQFDLRH